MANPIPMPSRGNRSAPKFDPKQPRGLRRYFDDLDFAFGRAGVTDVHEMKQHACRYVDVDTSELWETLEAYTDVTKTYDQFKDAVYALYPGSDEERKWSVADMDQLVGERSRLGILSLSDLGEYHRQFLAITTFLISKGRLSEAEQSRAFVRGFPPDLWRTISQRLQLKFPDHFPDDPYPLLDIHQAARYVLHGTPATQPVSSISATAATSQSTTSEVKTEDLAAILERITETFVKALTATAATARADRPPRPAQTNGNCNFCNEPGHFGRECLVADEYINAGKCRRDVQGKIVLATGAWIPRDLPGKCFKDRIDEWHRRNPGQLAAGQLMYNVLSQSVAQDSPPPVIATRQTHANLFDTAAQTQSLSAEQRIASLERELFQLRNLCPRAGGRKDREPNVDIPEDEPRKKKPVMRPEVVIPRSNSNDKQPEPRPTSPAPIPTRETQRNEQSSSSEAEVTHPYADVPDATYAPPVNRNYATVPKPSPPKKNEPAYKTSPPIYDGKVASNVYDRAMDAQVTLTQRELLSLSPEVRAQVREATSNKRVAPGKDAPKGINVLADDPILPMALDDINSDEEDEPIASTFTNSVMSSSTLPPGALVIPDPYEMYLKSLPAGVVPRTLIASKESSALRSIFPLVDHQQEVESIIDPGSQIIAMAEEICMELGLIYDPTIVLNMQSANGEVDRSLGLARNVPMQIGDITLYVQIHIIRKPAYDILLGRPFDILTESVVRNFANEDQTLTIRDPNSGRRGTIPTMPRGRPRHSLKQQNF